MKTNDLPKPTSQNQEVLFELIKRVSIDRPYMMMTCHVFNLTARISNLRNMGVSIETITKVGKNKFGREVKYCRYCLRDKKKAIELYRSII